MIYQFLKPYPYFTDAWPPKRNKKFQENYTTLLLKCYSKECFILSLALILHKSLSWTLESYIM